MKRLILFFGIITIVIFVSFIEKGLSMRLFDKIFGTKNVVQVKNLSEHRQFIDSLREPAIRIEKGNKSGLSKIGGLPIGNVSLRWPIWKGKPLAFLCQVDLDAIPKSEFSTLLPSEGILYFFYDQEQSTWGFDPKDRGSWNVIYISKKNELKPINAPAGLGKEYIYKEKNIKFSKILIYPDWQDDRIDKLNLNDSQSDEYFELRSSIFQNQPAHQLLGYPSPVQGNDMDLESQLVSNGLYCGDATGYRDPKAKELESGRNDWILLLQLDSDDDAGMMWGDVGMLYFWIRKSDLKKNDFSNVWMILQCS
ncbi:MAG: DUF1963 domain-containing protein [Desulfobacteraceae bacterium]|nr:DUF1963 domain-containing protein [Desulfobacteraceae bacterium]